MASTSEILSQIADRLLLLRVAYEQPNQAAFARYVGVTPQTLNNYENAYSRLSLDAAIKIASRTRVTLDWLYFGNVNGLPVDVYDRLMKAEARQNRQHVKPAS